MNTIEIDGFKFVQDEHFKHWRLVTDSGSQSDASTAAILLANLNIRLQKIIDTSEKRMSEYQLCPVCQGSGIVQDVFIASSNPYHQCDVCHGDKVLIKPFISELIN